ncbi:unnamed protein product [Brassicogethes aeneus]|uniref:General transcription factor 3C polypeptide 5 n=1 Tax=Brassicogethes aeneus TaxID=1431903 RepID=A0A9P0B6R2_BRAAE|nr:unnamed protein product [Brassicogethes aeneus]
MENTNLQVYKKIKNKRNKCVAKQTNISMSKSNTSELVEVKKKLVRVEYPGIVKNLSKALETLGGNLALELAVADPKTRLELRFHPKNKFNKSTVGERDFNPGLLIKINQNTLEYEVVGSTVINFTFNRISDFQYLPLVETPCELQTFKAEYIYDNIFPKEIPTLKWFTQRETKEQKRFFMPSVFSRFEYSSQNKLFLNVGEKYEHHLRPEIAETVLNMTKKQRKTQQSIKQISIFIDFQNLNVNIPEKPLDYAMQLVKDKQLEEQYKIIKTFFDKRPMWTKVAIVHRSGVSMEHIKVVLPAVAYFCNTGPWRMAWIKYGYNPQKDSSSRVYQILDYRIRTAEGTKLKVNAKRNYASKAAFYFSNTNLQNVSLNDKFSSKKNFIDESSYILRPTTIPPARQMFYHYCDIYIPEIQDMLARLPRPHSESNYDSKNGWLPQNFTEQCREIVNSYVLGQVQKQLLEENKRMKEHSDKIEDKMNIAIPTYCSEMLNNIKKGIYKSVNIDAPQTNIISSKDNKAVNTIDLLNDDLEQVNADEIIADTIPERLEENSDEDHLSQASDYEIDMEAVEEVNKMIIGIQEETKEVNIVTSYLKKL